MDAEPMDAERVESLAMPIFDLVKARLAEKPPHRDKVFECLNALAIVAGTMIAGTGSEEGRGEARKFFDLAVTQQIADH